MTDLGKTITAIEIFLDIISKDISEDVENEKEGCKVIKPSEIKLGMSESRKKAYDYLNVLDKQILVDVETAMYIGREMQMGSNYDFSMIADLKKARREMQIYNDEHCDSQIMGKNTKCLLEYFYNFLKVAKHPEK